MQSDGKHLRNNAVASPVDAEGSLRTPNAGINLLKTNALAWRSYNSAGVTVESL